MNSFIYIYGSIFFDSNNDSQSLQSDDERREWQWSTAINVTGREEEEEEEY